MACFKASVDHGDDLLEYLVAAYISFIGDMIKLMIKKGIEVVILVLTYAKNLYSPQASLSQTT